MTLSARMRRLEQKAGTGDPYADLSDEDLEAAIMALRAQIGAAGGMPGAEYAQDLSQRPRDGTPPDDLDPETATRFILRPPAEMNDNTRSPLKGQ